MANCKISMFSAARISVDLYTDLVGWNFISAANGLGGLLVNLHTVIETDN